jgi:hypothetical protein
VTGYGAAMVSFEAPIQAGRGGGAFVEIPPDSLQELGGGTRFRVRGTLAGVALESSTMGIGAGRVALGLHKATREAAGVAIGDTVHIEVERDDRERAIVIPPEFEAALRDAPDARAFFDRLAPTHRRSYAEWIAGAKRAETKERRLARAIELLRAGVREP